MTQTTAEFNDERIDVVRAFHTRFGEGNLDAAFALMHPECKLDEANGLPYSGIYIGPAGFGKLLDKMTSDLDHDVRYREISSSEDFVLLRIVVAFKSRKTGREIFSKLLETYSVEDGAITAIDVYYKNPQAIRELAELG